MNSFYGSGNGTEALVSSEISKVVPYAVKLCENFNSLRFKNRGVKFQKLYEMNHIKAPNIIFELCFCDSETDIEIYNQYSWEQLSYRFCNAIDSNIPNSINYDNKKSGYVVTNYLLNGEKGDGSFEGVDLNYVLSYFKDVKGSSKGVWVETQYLPMNKCNELKNTLGSWFYKIENNILCS